MATFSVVVPTAGRPTLSRTLAATATQLAPGDEMIVVRRDCEYGNKARDDAMRRAAGTHLLFIDDDDEHAPGALDTIRGYVDEEPDAIHVFRMIYGNGDVLWYEPVWCVGNIGTPMVCVPNDPHKLGRWENEEGETSDFAFFRQTLGLREQTPVFHDHIVAFIRP